jgi:hypothetical protein
MGETKKTLTFVGGAVAILAATIGGLFGREIARSFLPSRNAVLSQQALSEAANQIAERSLVAPLGGPATVGPNL